MVSTLLKHNKIYILIISLLILLFIASSIISPILIKNREQNWDKTIIDLTDALENSVNESLDKKFSRLIEVSRKLKTDLSNIAKKDSIDQKVLFNTVLNQKYKNYNLQLFNSDKELICWNSRSVVEESDFPDIKLWTGQTFFSKNKLNTYFTFLIHS